MEYHVAAADGQVIDQLAAHPVLLGLNAGDLANNGILVAFDATGHEAGIYDGIQILLHGSSGNLGVQVNILNGQSLHGILVALLGSL